METLFLKDREIRDIVDVTDVIDAVEKAFVEKYLGRVQMPPKVYIYYDSIGDLRVMPCYLSHLKISSVKLVNVHPQNRKYGLPTVMAVIALINPETGFPKAIMGGTWITAMRTCAAGAIAAKYLARSDSKIVAIIGAGIQGRTQVMGLSAVIPSLEEIKVYDVNKEIARDFIRFVKEKYGSKYRLVISGSPREAVENADIVITATPSRSPIIMREWTREGMHFTCIGADAPGKEELDPRILKHASKIVVDDVEQAIHSGEINVPLSRGILRREDIYGELGEIVTGVKPGRESPTEITVFASTGLAVQDAVTAELVYRKALEKGIGLKIEFI